MKDIDCRPDESAKAGNDPEKARFDRHVIIDVDFTAARGRRASRRESAVGGPRRDAEGLTARA